MTAPTTDDEPSTAPGGLAPLLELTDLTVDFRSDDGLVHAVRGVSYRLHPGKVLAVVGESGSGKSVTSLAIMGLLPRSAKVTGSVRFKGRELLGMKVKELNTLRGNRLAMIFQDPMTSLNPVYSVGWQLAEAVRTHHRDVSKRGALERAVDLLALVGIPNPEKQVHSYPHQFSGGMRQRVVIAIAMANDPDVIIADEPTTALDVTVQAQILETLQKAREETNAALVLITHDLGVVAGAADEVLVMYAGAAVERGSVDDIFYRPRMPYTVGLLGSLPRLDSDDAMLTPIPGAPPSLINLPPGCPFSPRCPLATDVCLIEEPRLRPSTSPDHVAACHHMDQLEGDTTPGRLFATGSAPELDGLPVPGGVAPDPSGGTAEDGAPSGEVAT